MTVGARVHRRRWMKRGVTLALATAAAFLLVAPAAHAHPFIRGGEAPVDSLAELTLAMAHGCGTETTAGGDPTTEVALEVPQTMRIVDVPEPDGWQVVLERDEQGRVEIVIWEATTAVEPAPDLEFSAVIDGTPGDDLYLPVFQACDDFAYRWIGTPDNPAADPAVRLRLAEADPDRPAPPEPEPQPDPEPTPEPESQPGTPDTDASADASEQEEQSADNAAETDELADDPTATDSLTLVPLILIAGALAVLVAGGLWWRRRG